MLEPAIQGSRIGRLGWWGGGEANALLGGGGGE